jgi:hypothetical protein
MRDIPHWLVLALALLLGPFTELALAEDTGTPIELIVKDHRFSPAEIHVPAGKPVFIRVTNQDPTPEEFELRQLAIEKVIPGGAGALVRIRPLGPGRYAFIGDFHSDLANGAIVAE